MLRSISSEKNVPQCTIEKGLHVVVGWVAPRVSLEMFSSKEAS